MILLEPSQSQLEMPGRRWSLDSNGEVVRAYHGAWAAPTFVLSNERIELASGWSTKCCGVMWRCGGGIQTVKPTPHTYVLIKGDVIQAQDRFKLLGHTESGKAVREQPTSTDARRKANRGNRQWGQGEASLPKQRPQPTRPLQEAVRMWRSPGEARQRRQRSPSTPQSRSTLTRRP